ncbi:MAG: hypothetical protein AAFV72_21595 [Cyanobacteria bacterium J06635_1]
MKRYFLTAFALTLATAAISPIARAAEIDNGNIFLCQQQGK